MYIRVRKGNLFGVAYKVHKAGRFNTKVPSTDVSNTHLKKKCFSLFPSFSPVNFNFVFALIKMHDLPAKSQ